MCVESSQNVDNATERASCVHGRGSLEILYCRGVTFGSQASSLGAARNKTDVSKNSVCTALLVVLTRRAVALVRASRAGQVLP